MTDRCQRWREHRDSYRPAGEPIETHRYEVAVIPGDAEAKAFVTTHHYSRSYPAAVERFGLYRGAELAGVAVFSVSFPGVLRDFPDPASATELGRFVLLDDVPANGETWFLARAFELLRRDGYTGVLSMSDPIPRTTIDGRQVTPGHVGTIYQAHNGLYYGRATARTLRLLPDGTVFSDRAIQKIRARERGWRYAAAQLEAFGAPLLGPSADSKTWLLSHLSGLTRAFRHSGNHKYVWPLDRRLRRHLKPGAPYPKAHAR